MASEKKSEVGTIPTKQVALLLMISEERVRQLVKQGYIPRAAAGRFNLVAAVQGYIKFLKDEDRRSSKSAAESRVRDARAAEIERRMAREDRQIIALDEALGANDEMTGEYLQSIAGLPARITRNPSERRRIEAICDTERGRLATRFAEIASNLRSGIETPDPDAEDDA